MLPKSSLLTWVLNRLRFIPDLSLFVSLLHSLGSRYRRRSIFSLKKLRRPSCSEVQQVSLPAGGSSLWSQFWQAAYKSLINYLIVFKKKLISLIIDLSDPTGTPIHHVVCACVRLSLLTCRFLGFQVSNVSKFDDRLASQFHELRRWWTGSNDDPFPLKTLTVSRRGRNSASLEEGRWPFFVLKISLALIANAFPALLTHSRTHTYTIPLCLQTVT